jgi:uncharacterized membrane protein
LSEHAPQSGEAARASGPLPIVIGIAGHRLLEPAHHPLYEARIRELFAQLRTRYPATPLRVLSSLAEGADRIAAAVALDQGWELLAPLPMPPAEYQRDFPDSLSEFRAVVARLPPENVFVLPAPPAAAGATAQEQRDACYREVGVFIGSQCHLLVTLWDGVHNNAVGGTAEVVRFKLEGQIHGDPRVLEVDDRGPVYHIHAARAGTGADVDIPVKWLFPEGVDAERLHAACRRIDRFNRDALRVPVPAAQLPDAAGLLPQMQARPGSDRRLAGTFASADTLARGYQRLTYAVLRLILGFALALALTFDLFVALVANRALPLIYLLILAATVLLYLWQRRLHAQGRYLDYRALAEALRVQFYWRLAGLNDSAAGSYLRKQLDELRWIRDALRGASALPPPRDPRPDLVQRHWVRGQAAYYSRRASALMARIRRAELTAAAFLGAGLLATAALIIGWNRLGPAGRARPWLVLLMGFAPLAAALWQAYGERFGMRSRAHQYGRFAALFVRAERALARLEASPQAAERLERERALIGELGREALTENGDWVLLLRNRPIVLPKA